MSKYEIEAYSNCMGTYITVNDESIYDLSDDVLLDFRKALCAKLLKGLLDGRVELYDILQIIRCSMQVDDSSSCGQCGHHGVTQKWEI
jgi:hypothetical protein